jgi:hypothetical protein
MYCKSDSYKHSSIPWKNFLPGILGNMDYADIDLKILQKKTWILGCFVKNRMVLITT